MPNLYDTLLERMEGRQYGHYFSCYCVFDRHESPALLVFEDGMFKCLSCNKIGNHQELDRKTGSHFIPQRNDAVSKLLPRWRKWEDKYGDLEGIADAAHRTLKKFPQFQKYFRKRKIYEFADEGSLGYLDGFVSFPVFNKHRTIIDIVVRSVSKSSDIRYVIHPGICDVRPLYVPSWEKVNEAETVYVVYGVCDSISLHLAGLPSVTGVTGKSLSPELLKPLHKRFVIVPDAGEEKEAHKLANALGWRAKVKKIDFPDGCKDPDIVRRLYGDSKLLELIGVSS